MKRLPAVACMLRTTRQQSLLKSSSAVGYQCRKDMNTTQTRRNTLPHTVFATSFIGPMPLQRLHQATRSPGASEMSAKVHSLSRGSLLTARDGTGLTIA